MKTAIAALSALMILGLSARAEEAAKDTYPLTTCVVSEEPLNSMGDPVIFQYEGREVRFCCKDCKKDFLKDPAKYLKMIDDAAAKKAEGKTADDKKKAHTGHEHHHE